MLITTLKTADKDIVNIPRVVTHALLVYINIDFQMKISAL